MNPVVTSLLLAISGYFVLVAARRLFHLELSPRAFAILFNASVTLSAVGLWCLVLLAPREYLGLAFPLIVVSYYWRALLPNGARMC